MVEIKSIPEIIEEISPYYKKKKEPESKHTLLYESYAESLEPAYYFVLDLMNSFGLKPEKLIDNFSTSPSSTQFGDIGTRATAMQQHASQALANINTVLRSVLNIIYDLKDFKSRLQSYDDLHSSDKEKSNAARLSLKTVWMDKVDVLRGNSSIKGLAVSQGGAFGTLIDAFLVADDIEAVKKLDLNDVVKRVVTPRIQEFNLWVASSEQELRKRYELERNYLRSQVNSLKLYSRWAKPYLTAAQQLEQKTTKNPALVKSFNRTILELTLLGKRKLKIKDAAIEGKLPDNFKEDSFLKKIKRDYTTCILVDFVFTAVPVKQQSSYVGRVEITFRGYSLNDDELKKLEKELEKSDLQDGLSLIEGITDDSLKQMQKEINDFLEEKEPEKKQQEKPKDSSNPFLALIGHYDKEESKKESKDNTEKPVQKDNWIEKEHLRKLTAEDAGETAFTLFDIYKKAHRMPSYT